jgi:hypothetical protein
MAKNINKEEEILTEDQENLSEDSKTEDKEVKDSSESKEELDFGVKKEDTKEDLKTEEEVPVINLEELISEAKLKPDFKTAAKMFLSLTKEVNEESLIALEKEFEIYLQETLVPKVEKALGVKSNVKPGVESSKTEAPKERVTTPLKDRK